MGSRKGEKKGGKKGKKKKKKKPGKEGKNSSRSNSFPSSTIPFLLLQFLSFFSIPFLFFSPTIFSFFNLFFSFFFLLLFSSYSFFLLTPFPKSHDIVGMIERQWFWIRCWLSWCSDDFSTFYHETFFFHTFRKLNLDLKLTLALMQMFKNVNFSGESFFDLNVSKYFLCSEREFLDLEKNAFWHQDQL